MIKIIKPGTRKTTSCEKCGCLFSYEQKDIRMKEQEIPSVEYVECPQCLEFVFLKSVRAK